MNEQEYIAATLLHVQPGPVYFPAAHCLLCAHGRCTLEHREPDAAPIPEHAALDAPLDAQDAPLDAPLDAEGQPVRCYFCWNDTARRDQLLCSYSPLHAAHHHCLKLWGNPRCGVCNTGRFGAAMNRAASLHVLYDLRHLRREVQPHALVDIPLDAPAGQAAPVGEPEQVEGAAEQAAEQREEVFRDLLRVWKATGLLVAFALVLNAVVSLFR